MFLGPIKAFGTHQLSRTLVSTKFKAKSQQRSPDAMPEFLCFAVVSLFAVPTRVSGRSHGLRLSFFCYHECFMKLLLNGTWDLGLLNLCSQSHIFGSRTNSSLFHLRWEFCFSISNLLSNGSIRNIEQLKTIWNLIMWLLKDNVISNRKQRPNILQWSRSTMELCYVYIVEFPILI